MSVSGQVDFRATLKVPSGVQLPRYSFKYRPVNIEAAKTVKVGRVYLVNVVSYMDEYYSAFPRTLDLPVLGTLHEDPEIGAPFLHFHVDWRFVSDSAYKMLTKSFESAVSVATERGDIKGYADNTHLAIAIYREQVIGEPQRRALECVRPHALYNSQAPFLPALERAYQSKRVCDNKCPHRQISLVGAPEDKNGVRVCPGHGLAWNREGRLVPRTGQSNRRSL